MEFPDSKAREVLEAYNSGERSFRGIVLCGAYFANPDINNPIRYDLSGADFSAGIFNATFFGPVNLSHSSLRGAKIDEASFAGADMQKANLRQVSGGEVDLSRVNLEGAYLSQACLSRSSLEGSNLRNVDLRQAALEWCTLKRADFRGANLRYCSMCHSSIERADFRGASEYQTDFGEDSYAPGTIYPNGRIDEGYFRSEVEFRGELDTEKTAILEEELLRLYRDFYDSLIEDSNSQRCEHEDCLRNRVQNANLCELHYFELIQRKKCPFSH
jgi:hypothetical protein